jgi:hydrogenase expression/formation protein HypE
VVGREGAVAALAALRIVSPQAALIGEIVEPGKSAPQVVLSTAFGGERSLDELEEDPLPRIC